MISLSGERFLRRSQEPTDVKPHEREILETRAVADGPVVGPRSIPVTRDAIPVTLGPEFCLCRCPIPPPVRAGYHIRPGRRAEHQAPSSAKILIGPAIHITVERMRHFMPHDKCEVIAAGRSCSHNLFNGRGEVSRPFIGEADRPIAKSVLRTIGRPDKAPAAFAIKLVDRQQGVRE